MTAHKTKPVITPERIEWFAKYYIKEPAWGVFHVSLDDENYDLGAASEHFRPADRDAWPDDVREAAAWFDTLTRSQRQRLHRKATDLARQQPMLGLHVRVIAPGPKR